MNQLKYKKQAAPNTSGAACFNDISINVRLS